MVWLPFTITVFHSPEVWCHYDFSTQALRSSICVDSPQFGHAEIDHVSQPCSDKAAADKSAAEKAAADKAAADKAAADKAAADKAAADIAVCS